MCVAIIGLLLLSACSSGGGTPPDSGTRGPTSADSSTAAPLPSGDRIADSQALLDQVRAVSTCTVTAGPEDVIQSPYAVDNVTCEPDNTRLFVYGADGDARRYQMQQVEIGSGVSLGYLVGPNWLVIAPPATLMSLRDRVGGGLYTDKATALAATPGQLIDSPYPDCHVSFTAGVMEYVESGNDVIVALDQVVYPGMHDLFAELVQPTVKDLPAFGSRDYMAVYDQLGPLSPLLREVCRRLFPKDA